MDKSIQYRLTLFIALLALLSSCLDEYNPPEISNSESLLVVEGNISDTEANIRLTRTSELGNNELVPVNNAIVKLENEDGNFNIDLSALDGGFYNVTALLDIDDKYRITIQTESDVYASEFLNLLPTPPIDSVGWDSVDDVFQVHVSTHDDDNDTRYYLWRFEETWQYRSRYPSDFKYENGEVIPRLRDERISVCWKSETSTSVLIGTTINLNQDVVFKQPLHQIQPTENLKLSNRYSILVRQNALSKEAFEFWELLKKNSESVGTFFDPQPSQLPTNLNCISNPEKPVIGFVSASQEQQERIYVNRSDLPFKNIPFATVFSCELDTVSTDPEEVKEQFESGRNLITFEIMNLFGTVIGYQSAPKFCADCREFGGTNQEPGFWIN